MVKMTFTLDDEAVSVLRKTAERRRMLRSIDALLARAPSRTAAAVDRELKAVRTARRRGGRRS